MQVPVSNPAGDRRDRKRARPPAPAADWTVTTDGPRATGDEAGKHCHRYETKRAAAACAERRVPWHGPHGLALVNGGTKRVKWPESAAKPVARWIYDAESDEIVRLP